MIPKQLIDIYAISSIYFIKGIMDAQRVCDPSLVEEVIESEKLTLIRGSKRINMFVPHFMKFVKSDMSRHGLLTFRGALDNYNNKSLERELCYLLDFIYKKGCAQAGKYEGRNMKRILEATNSSSSTFLTPDGNQKPIVWNDMIRQYLTELKIVYRKITTEILDRYMADLSLNEKKLEEIQYFDDERRKFILSGGDVPSE